MPANALFELRRIAGYVDSQFHPQLQELPALFGALVHRLEHGDKLSDVIAQGEEDAKQLGAGAVGNEVHEAVSRLLSPPPEDPQSEYQTELGRIRDEQQQLLDRLRTDSEQVQAQLDELRNYAGSGAQVPAPVSPAAPDAPATPAPVPDTPATPGVPPAAPDAPPAPDVPPAPDPSQPPADVPPAPAPDVPPADPTAPDPNLPSGSTVPPPITGSSPELSELLAAQAAYERAAIRVAQLSATTVTHETGPGV